MYGRKNPRYLSSYNYYRDLYLRTKPIRGRKVECRPIGNRRRDWEEIVKVSDTAYAARLYATNCVTYNEDGSVDLFIDTFATPTTAEFIHTHSPFICSKRYNQLWIISREAGGESKWIPLIKRKVLKMVLDADGCWTPSEPVVMQQKRVDRKKANAAREPLRKFLQFGKAMLAMSDGWVRHDTKCEFAEVKPDYWRVKYTFRDIPEAVGCNYDWQGNPHYKAENMYKFLTKCDEDMYFPAYLFLLNSNHYYEERRVATTYSHGERYEATAYDNKYSFDYFKRLVYKIADEANDIHKVVEVEAGDCALTNVA